MNELSERSGVPIPSIKFYLRRNLLPPGASTSANQASYDEVHLGRLRLIRALMDIGGLSVAATREVLESVDAPDLPLSWVFGAAQYAISQADLYTTPASDSAVGLIRSLARDHGWSVTADNPGLTGAANVVDAFVALGHPELLELIDEYATAAEIVARADLRAVNGQPNRSAMAETVVAGTVLGDAMLAALRRVAQEHVALENSPNAAGGDRFGRGERAAEIQSTVEGTRP